ncbi:Macrocin-O-methyltransferase (TylF) [Lotmaria passim]
MRCTFRCLAESVAIAAKEVVSNCVEAIRRGRAAAALPRLNHLKAQRIDVEGVDYARALCFLSGCGAGRGVEHRNAFEARQSLLEELRLHPRHQQARLLLQEVNEVVRPLLLPPSAVQKQYPLFALLCDALLDSTMLSWPRLLHLYEAAERVACAGSTVDRGHIVECGTAGGGSAVLMAVVLAEREAVTGGDAHCRCVFALDTFAGMPAPGSKDFLVHAPPTKSPNQGVEDVASWGTGTCSSPASHVQQLARAFAVENRLVTMPGLFEESIPGQLLTRPDIQNDGIAVLHLDADWYASTHTALELLLPVMRRLNADKETRPRTHAPPSPRPARVVQVDDYHYWSGCRTAVDEYLAAWPSPPLSANADSSSHAPHLEDVDDNAVYFFVQRDIPFHAL